MKAASSRPPATGPGWSAGRAPPGRPAFRTPPVEPVEPGIEPARRPRPKERFRGSGQQHRERDDATMPAPSIRRERPWLGRVWTRCRPYASTVPLGAGRTKRGFFSYCLPPPRENEGRPNPASLFRVRRGLKCRQPPRARRVGLSRKRRKRVRSDMARSRPRPRAPPSAMRWPASSSDRRRR
jgi:hypothetical protein